MVNDVIGVTLGTGLLVGLTILIAVILPGNLILTIGVVILFITWGVLFASITIRGISYVSSKAIPVRYTLTYSKELNKFYISESVKYGFLKWKRIYKYKRHYAYFDSEPIIATFDTWLEAEELLEDRFDMEGPNTWLPR